MNSKENHPSILEETIRIQKEKECREEHIKAIYIFYYELLKKFGIKEEGSESRGLGAPNNKMISWKLEEIKFEKGDYKLEISVKNGKYYPYPDEEDKDEPKEISIFIDISCFKKENKSSFVFNKEKPLSMLSICLEPEGKMRLTGDDRYEDYLIALEDCLELAGFIEEKLSKK